MTRIHYDIPDDLHREAKAEAARRGMTLGAYIEWSLGQTNTGRSLPPVDPDEIAARRRQMETWSAIGARFSQSATQVRDALLASDYDSWGYQPGMTTSCQECGTEYDPTARNQEIMARRAGSGPSGSAKGAYQFCSLDCNHKNDREKADARSKALRRRRRQEQQDRPQLDAPIRCRALLLSGEQCYEVTSDALTKKCRRHR